MTQSSNRLRRFLSHGPFAWSKKRDFLNIYNDDLLSIASDLFLSLFLPKQEISSARRLHVFHLQADHSMCSCLRRESMRVMN